MLPHAPAPRMVPVAGDMRVAAYEVGDPQAEPVLCIHGFTSSAEANWVLTGWSRELTRAGRRLILIDQRAHGASSKPHDPARYSMRALCDDAFAVLDAAGVDRAAWIGYSLGARVTWQAALRHPERVSRAVLGGIPTGDPFARFDLTQARDHVARGTPIEDPMTRMFVEMARTLPGNDLEALICLVEGVRGGENAGVERTPEVPLLVAAGSRDPIAEQARSLAEAAAQARFVSLPERTHANAPTSGAFRREAAEFLAEGRS